MKRIFYLPILILALFSFSSCEDDSKNPLPERVSGQFIKLDIDRFHRQLDNKDIANTYFAGILSNPGGTVVKYDLSVRRRDGGGIETGDYVPLLSVNSFPYELKITPAMIAEALGLSLSDLQAGDFYRFYGVSYDANGNAANYTSLSALNRTTDAMEQGYRFNTNLTDAPDVVKDDGTAPYDNRQE